VRTSATQPTRVLLVDDDAIARRALREAVGRSPFHELAGEAAGAGDAIAAVAEVRPDVVVMDAEMPGTDGITATLLITERTPGTQVLVLSLTEDDEVALAALRAGALGFMLKTAPIEASLRAIRGVGQGEAAISRRLTRRIIVELRTKARERSGVRPVYSELTPREWQVLDLLSRGGTTDSISGHLEVSVDTVRTHIKHVLRKLGAHTRAEAVMAAERLRAEPDRPVGHNGK
jgi:DNA-binding NarL/FixJ family response regulator